MSGRRDVKKCAARGGMTRAEVVRAVFNKYGNCCADCGLTNKAHIRLTGKALEVHRLVPGSMYTVDGCVLLCRTCHGTKPKRPAGAKDEEGRAGTIVCLPEAYRALLRELKRKTDRPIAASVRRGVDAELKANGIEPAKPRKRK